MSVLDFTFGCPSCNAQWAGRILPGMPHHISLCHHHVEAEVEAKPSAVAALPSQPIDPGPDPDDACTCPILQLTIGVGCTCGAADGEK